MATITPEQLALLQTKVQTLTSDKADADAKTQASNQADTLAAQAQAAANQAKLDEAQADSKVSADLSDLQAFIDGLAGGPAPTPVPSSRR